MPDRELFAILRVGKDSADVARRLDAAQQTAHQVKEEIICKQVSAAVKPGTIVFIWLGSDNDKGSPTDWKQGIRAVGRIIHKEGGESYSDQCKLTVSVELFLVESMDKMDMIRTSPSAYYWIATMPVVGIQSYSNQTVQVIHADKETQDVRALLYLFGRHDSAFQEAFALQFPEIANLLDYYPPDPSGRGQGKADVFTNLSSEDPLLVSFSKLLNSGHRTFLFLGPPGTGKTYFAHRVAASIVEDPDNQLEVIQFHQSYSYDDFIEGYIPSPSSSHNSSSPFVLKPKIFKNICERAQNNPDKLYVLVIDELNRGDSSRIFGEVLTYIEDDYRDQKFKLTYSGVSFSIPKNLVLIATMNPYDHSVADLDAALDRRFSKFSFEPSKRVLSENLRKNNVNETFEGIVVSLFESLQTYAPYGGLGHAFFLKVRDAEDLQRVWDHQLRFVFQRVFWDDEASFDQVLDVFSQACEKAEAVGGPSGADNAESSSSSHSP